jgi:hypothetical protein
MRIKLNPVKANCTILETPRFNILFSYKTPVAIQDTELDRIYVTLEHYSTTTTRHINSYIKSLGYWRTAKIAYWSQDLIDKQIEQLNIGLAL